MSATNLMLRKAVATDSTSSAAFTVKTPTATEPDWQTTAGGPVWWLLDPNNGIATSHFVPEFLNVIPYGTTTDNQTLNLRVWGWKRMRLIPTPLWVPILLAEVAGIMSSGIAATSLAASGLGCDTLTVTYGATDERTLGVSAISPTTDQGQASALIHLRGCEYIEFAFKVGTAVSMNALWCCMDQD